MQKKIVCALCHADDVIWDARGVYLQYKAEISPLFMKHFMATPHVSRIKREHFYGKLSARLTSM